MATFGGEVKLRGYLSQQYRIQETVQARLKAVSGRPIGKFVESKLGEELKRFHNPNSEKTKKLFSDDLEIDVCAGWKWAGYEPATAKKKLDDLISKRGDAVHRSRVQSSGAPPPHLLSRDELDKAIKFLKALVEATEKALADV